MSASSEATVTIQKSSSTTKMEGGYNVERSVSMTEMKGPEVSAPVFPMEVSKHNYPPEAPPHEQAHGKDDLKYPVYGVDGKHQYKEKTPKPLEEKHLTGPVFEVERSHSFKMEEKISESNPTLQAPAYDVGHQHKFPADGKLDMGYPSAPKDKEQKLPIYDAPHKSTFETPIGYKDKPPLPKDLTGTDSSLNITGTFNQNFVKLQLPHTKWIERICTLALIWIWKSIKTNQPG